MKQVLERPAIQACVRHPTDGVEAVVRHEVLHPTTLVSVKNAKECERDEASARIANAFREPEEGVSGGNHVDSDRSGHDGGGEYRIQADILCEAADVDDSCRDAR
ncbi:hypothetical protein [Acidisphaera sp. S103]|uniref:hypothetical protein n=1 Tax=Acidisphaera sp. S103 TaxID=1747223 RepID=UPI00131D92B4|nr:hypothetical protein [Acidisphaera sp. S103]